MIQISICDDEAAVRDTLCQFFSQLDAPPPFQLSLYAGAEELLARGGDVDILLIDVQMPGMDGISAARELRRRGCPALIIFITNYIQYAIDGYEVQAYHFLKKPVEYQRFAAVLGGALALAQRRTQACITVSGYDQRVKLPLSSILYCETDRGHVVIHTPSQAIRCTQSMAQMEEQVRGQDFFRIHTAYLVNMAAIDRLLPTQVQLTGGILLPISKHRKQSFREALTFYWGGNF